MLTLKWKFFSTIQIFVGDHFSLLIFVYLNQLIQSNEKEMRQKHMAQETEREERLGFFP